MGSNIRVDSEQLLPTIFEYRARTNPHGIWARFPVSATSYELGFQAATHIQILNAINNVAWLLEKHLGKSTDFETLAYIGPNDLRYTILIIAAIKAGYKMFMPSPRNSKPAHISLLSRLKCKLMITTTPEMPFIPVILEEYKMQRLQIPGLEELLNSDDTPFYPYEKTFEEAKNDPIFVLHTSGSTGIPKPLIYTHKFATGIVNATSLPAPKGFRRLDKFLQSGNFFQMLPSFHIAGVGFSIIMSAFYGSVPVYPLPGGPPTFDGFVDAIKHGDFFDWAFLPPVIIDELSKDPAALDLVAGKLRYLYYTGGSLPASSGDIISPKIPLYQVMGSSECATLPLLRQESDYSDRDWNYIHINPAVHPEFRHRLDDLYELVFIRMPDSEPAQPVFLHFPHLQEYETRDLFSPHPFTPNLWRHRSRIDDVIVFLNGEKTNPVSFEHEVSGNPEIRSALVVGQQRVEPSLLIELVDSKPLTSEEQVKTIERLWPTIQQANRQCPTHAKVSKSKILFTDSLMPMLRAGKGTVQRQATLDLYSKRLDDLYNENHPNNSDIHAQRSDIDLTREINVAQKVHEIVAAVTEWGEFGNEADFFSLGMDSLQVLQLRRELKNAFGLDSITTSAIYANPSVDLLTKEVMASASQSHTSLVISSEARIHMIASTLEKYERDIDRLAATTMTGLQLHTRRLSTTHTVVLTGSTGAVGSYVLEQLLNNKSVAHVYCLNRSINSESVQASRNTERRLPIDFPPSRVSFLNADLTKTSFGLDAEVYKKILNSVTLIIHNAWPVDFNRTLPSFQASLDGVMSLISFAAIAELSPSIFFLSSISSIANYHNTADAKTLIPEAVITDLSCPALMGYGESKYIAERMLDYAAQKLHLNTGAARIGQIAGTAYDPHGWNRNEWLPSLILSSRYLGAVPESLGSTGTASADDIDWVPIDQLSRILVELAFTLYQEDNNAALRVFHPINPRPTTWKSLLPTVMEALSPTPIPSPRPDMKIVPFSAWLETLRSKSAVLTDDGNSPVTMEILEENPGLKLLDFYESLLLQDQSGTAIKMDMREALNASECLRELDTIKPEWMAGWIKNWLSTRDRDLRNIDVSPAINVGNNKIISSGSSQEPYHPVWKGLYDIIVLLNIGHCIGLG